MNRRVVVILGVVAIAAGIGIYVFLTPRESAAPSARVVSPRPSRAPARRSPEPGPAVEATPATPLARASPGDNAPDAAPDPSPAESAPITATLTVDSDVAGAQVFIDRNFVGVTPATVSDLRPGSHRLNVTAAGYDGISQTIDVAPGPREITVEFKTIRLDATIGVVHKHAVGSCRGTLVATPDGLRYDTTNKGDAFTVALTDLDSFAVDYLERNLKLKLKNGKTYNFTDPDGNADRLFVFHRDVDKVRARTR